jgi:hypothetical protein
MRKLLFFLIAVAAIGLAAAYARRRRAETAETFTPAPTYPPPPAPETDVGTPPAPDIPVQPDVPESAPDVETREVESQATDETRFERLIERESDERRDTAARLRDDPLTERPDSGSES